MATKMAGVGMGSDEFTVESGPNGLEVPWSDSKLDSTRTEFIDNNSGGQRRRTKKAKTS